MKHIPNFITFIRILGSFFLLLTEPFSKLFCIIYVICGMSDILDGYIARKIKATSKAGQVMDSIADMIFIVTVLIIMIPIIKIPFWALYWIVAIAIIRIISLFIGFIKYNSFSSLHTYANKVTGGILFCFPIIYMLLGLLIASFLIVSIASISAIEELTINITSKKLNRDVKYLFSKKYNIK